MPGNSTSEESPRLSETEEPALPVNEVFYSLQGEGKLNGIPTVFIRTSGCNLRCWFCDSYQTSWEPTYTTMSIQNILDKVKRHDVAEHVVLTGGEPLIHENSVLLLDRLSECGYHTTVETNGTIYRDTSIDLASISPKLASSTPKAEKDPKGEGEWALHHEDKRINTDALTAFIENYDIQLKFVITDATDVTEVRELVADIRKKTTCQIPRSDILLMPEGTTREDLDNGRIEVAELAMKLGYRYTPRVHVDLWNDAPGT